MAGFFRFFQPRGFLVRDRLVDGTRFSGGLIAGALFNGRLIAGAVLNGRLIAGLWFTGLLFAGPGPALAAKGDCGQPSSTAANPGAADALYVLRTAVGSLSCDLCVCDVKPDAKVTAADALLVLKKAVGQDVVLDCPACVPALTGVVLLPVGQFSASSNHTPWESLVAAIFGTDAAASVSGLVPAAGATVELFSLDAEGNLQPPALGSTTTNADGGYRLTPLPDPGSQKIVRATLDGQTARAFVSAAVVDIDPVTEFVADSAIDAVKADAGAGLDTLTVEEIEALTRLVREADVDLSSAQTVAEATDLLASATAGVYTDVVGEFATGGGPSVALTGNYNLIAHAQYYGRSFQAPTLQTPGVNIRAVTLKATGSLATIAAGGELTRTNAVGRSTTLTTTSGSVKHESGPNTAINASVSLESEPVDEPGPAGQKLLGARHGALLLESNLTVSLGSTVAGGNLAVIPTVYRHPSNFFGGRFFDLALRQGSGLGESSLDGTYWMAQFEVGLGANTDSMNVHRRIEGIQSAGTMEFDGNGHLALGAAEGAAIFLNENGPPPDHAADNPTVTLNDEPLSEEPIEDLTYTLTSAGVLTVKSGEEVVAEGAVTPNAQVIVLRFGGEEEDNSTFGFLVAVKRGSGMDDSDGEGTYRSVSADLHLGRHATTGSPDTTPDTDTRSIEAGTSFGSFELDGNGHLTILNAVGRVASLEESSGVMRHSMGPDEVFDSVVSLRTNTDADGGPETAGYSIASNGMVTVDLGPDGTQVGYLSPDGNVFVLPQFESEDEWKSVSIMLGLREP